MTATTITAPPQSSRGVRFVRALVLTGAALLIAASAGLGTYFGYQSGSHLHWTIGAIFAIAALGGELLKPFAMAGAFDAFGRWQIGRGLACITVAGVCVIYSLAGELALSAGSRGDLTAKREKQAKTAGSADKQRDRAEAELAKTKPARSAAELEVLIRASPAKRGCAAENGTGRWICPPHPLSAELARAKRRADLEAVIAQPAAGPAPVAAVGHADPLASAVAHYASAAGYQVQPDDLSVWLYLVPVIFIEVCSAFGLVVARAATAGEATVAAAAKVADPSETVANLTVATLSGPATVSSKLLAPPAAGRAGVGDGRHVLTALQTAPRPLTNEQLAVAMGVSAGEASKRRARVAHLLDQVRHGRELRISLAGVLT